MQFISVLVSLALAGSALAAPTNPIEQRSSTPKMCGVVGAVGNGVSAQLTITGQYATPEQCSEDVQYTGYNSFSFHHWNNSCSFYSQTVSGLDIVSGTHEQIFFDSTCGDYSPTCNVQISCNADNTLKWGQQYAIKTLENVSNTECASECFELENCYATALALPNFCVLYSQSTSWVNANSPTLNSGKYAVQMSDLYCSYSYQ